MYSLRRNTIIVSRDVLFDEEASWNWEQGKVQKQAVIFQEEAENEDKDVGESSQSSPRADSSSSSSGVQGLVHQVQVVLQER